MSTPRTRTRTWTGAAALVVALAAGGALLAFGPDRDVDAPPGRVAL